MEWKRVLPSHTPPRPTPRACPRQHFLPKFLHHSQTGDTTGKRGPKKLEWLFHGHNLHSDSVGGGGGVG